MAAFSSGGKHHHVKALNFISVSIRNTGTRPKLTIRSVTTRSPEIDALLVADAEGLELLVRLPLRELLALADADAELVADDDGDAKEEAVADADNDGEVVAELVSSDCLHTPSIQTSGAHSSSLMQARSAADVSDGVRLAVPEAVALADADCVDVPDGVSLREALREAVMDCVLDDVADCVRDGEGDGLGEVDCVADGEGVGVGSAPMTMVSSCLMMPASLMVAFGRESCNDEGEDASST